MKDIFKIFLTKKNLNMEDVYFLYNGDIINSDLKLI